MHQYGGAGAGCGDAATTVLGMLSPCHRCVRRSAHRLAATRLLVLTLVLSLRAQAQPADTRRASSAASSAASSTAAGDALVGTVVDIVGRPFEDVEVYLAGTRHSVRSDVRGMWRIPNPPTGPHVVVARMIGYVPYVREVLISSKVQDTVTLLLRRYPRTLSMVEVKAQSDRATASATVVAERLIQMRVSAGRLYTRDQILEQRPYSVAELVQGIPNLLVKRGQGTITATSTRNSTLGTGGGVGCELQFFLDNTPLDPEGVAGLDPLTFRSVEVYPQFTILPGLSVRSDRCGAIVINTMRR